MPTYPDRRPTSPLELTAKAVVLGVILSAVLAAANAYLGLRVGMTVSASIPAAVVSMGVLRMWKRRGILENNIVQTAGSAGESLAAGVIFTLPALILIGFWSEFNYVWVTLIAGFGGLLGVLFTIPLRRALIVERPLDFPEGRATAEVLKVGDKDGSGVWDIAKAAIAGGLFKLGSSGLKLFGAKVHGAWRAGKMSVYLGSELSPALLAVGYIVGLNIALLIFLGGTANWLIAVPLTAATQPWPTGAGGKALSAAAYAEQIWSTRTRYIGVGGMLVGGLWAIWRMRGSVFIGITSSMAAYRKANESGAVVPRAERDISIKWVGVGTIIAAVALFAIYQCFVGSVTVTLPMAAVMLVLGFLFSAVAAYMAGVVGSSNNPISGVTIATVAISALLLVALMGSGAEDGPAAAIIIGSVVCCAAAIAGDNMQDLKAGHIVGATPWKQQVMQMVGVVAAALVIAPVLMVLQTAYGFAGHVSATGDDALTAPQSKLMASVAEGVFSGNLPWAFVLIGVGVAILIIVADCMLEARKKAFRMPVLAVAIGFYLPMYMSVPIFLGGLIRAAVAAHHRADPDRAAGAARRGILFASGLITGEALMGVALAIPIAITSNAKILKIADAPLHPWPGVLILLAIAGWLAAKSIGRRTRL